MLGHRSPGWHQRRERTVSPFHLMGRSQDDEEEDGRSCPVADGWAGVERGPCQQRRVMREEPNTLLDSLLRAIERDTKRHQASGSEEHATQENLP